MRLFAWLGGRTFASLRNHRNFRLYFFSHAVSFSGTWMQQIAAYWLVLELTGSPVAVGSLALAQALPVTMFGLFVGSVIDRFDVRRLLIVTESLLSVGAATLAVLTLTGTVELWHVYVIATFQGLVLVLDNPSRHTLVFRIVGEADLPNAVALSSALGTMARIAGPGLGGLVVALAGTGEAFAVNSLSYLAVVLALLAMRDLRPYVPPAVQTGFRRSIRVMLSFVRRSRRVAVAFFTVLALSTVSFNFDVLLPLVAGRTLDADADVFGLIAAVFGAGALCGALFLATLGKASLRLLLAGAGGFGVLELVLAPQQELLAVCALLFATGICYMLWGTSALASLQLAAPQHLRGQAASLYYFAFMGGAPFGGLLAGWLTSRGGTELAFAVAGTAAVLVSVAGADGPRHQAPNHSNRRRLECRSRIATPAAGSASPRGTSRRRSGSMPAPGARRRTTRPRASTARSPPRPRSSRRSTATSRRWRWSRSTSAGSSTSRTSRSFRATILERTGLDEAALLINMSHTHSGANVNSQLADKPGGELIEPYIEHLTEQIGAAILEARAALAPAWVTWGTGRCALATNRDFWDADAQRFAAGYNPDAPADDTLLVARVTGEDGELRATLFNYACHPTTLAWENRLLSPDYIGAAREVLENAFGAPGAVLPGRLGRARPARRLRRRHGRRRPQRPPARPRRGGGDREPAAARDALRLHGDRASGANLGTWEYQPIDAEQ